MLPYVAPFGLPELAQSLAGLKGVGPATAATLAGRDIRTWGDALFLFPSRYEDRREVTPIRQVEPGMRVVVRGKVLANAAWGKKRKAWRMVVADQGGRITCLWFHFKKAQMEAYAKGSELILVGLAEKEKTGGLLMTHPLIFTAGEAESHPGLGRVVPIYPEVEGVPGGRLMRFMGELVGKVAPHIPDPLYRSLPGELYPMPAGEALMQAHLPPLDASPDWAESQPGPWLKALAVNELLYFELGLAMKRLGRERASARALQPSGDLARAFVRGLPFKLTPGQKEAMAAIKADLAMSHPMGRLVCGDVATGKTVVAAVAACLAAEAGVQSAFMAPTEVLARQHAATLRGYLEPLGLTVTLATGSQQGAERQAARDAVAGGAQVVVGTHALISTGLEFSNLGLVIIDEQHRFGVSQRLGLAAKGEQPHILVLSATPIPRTLALALAGHLDISDLPQLPLGQPKVATRVIAHAMRRQAVTALEQTLARGEQAYVICPLVEASEVVEAQDAEQTQARLAAHFPQVKVGLLHGRMNGDEQQAALSRFKSGETPLLVATTVVEVGVDVAAATLMVVLGAERFGLSQLHQLRGRVGRGNRPGTCLLVAGPNPGELGQERLSVLASTTDGRVIAEADLRLRGPGEALGSKQSGLPPFRVANWVRDAELAPPLREIIAGWLAADPELSTPDLAPLRRETLRRWGRRLGLLEAG